MTDFLQTSPYLNVFKATEPNPVVYAIDEIPVSRPSFTPPRDAVFGVVELDRQVNWHDNSSVLDLLHAASAHGVSRVELEREYGSDAVEEVERRGWVIDPQSLCNEYLLLTVQIEVTAHCNWGCEFCPVSTDRKAPAVMPLPLFSKLIDEIGSCPTLRYVTFHFYNEPSLDPLFFERIAILRKHNIKLRLFTNASALDSAKLDVLSESGVLDHLAVNFPSLDKDVFRELTKSATYRKSLANLEAAVERELPMTVVINGSGTQLERSAKELRARYEDRGVRVVCSLMSDRAGSLSNQYFQGIRTGGRLRGCAWPVSHPHVSVSGKVFLCCNDYFQREEFGDLSQESLEEIMGGSKAVEGRRRVFGVSEAPKDYICRSCHDQSPDFPCRQFFPLASFPVAR